MRTSLVVTPRDSATVRKSETAVGLPGLTSVSTSPAQSGSSATYAISRRGRFWEVRDAAGILVCLTVYKCGAQEVIRRLDL